MARASAGASEVVLARRPEWCVLRGVHGRELRARHTFPTGQTFRWRARVDGDYVGVVGARVVRVREGRGECTDAAYKVYCRPAGETVEDDERVVREYFNADVRLVTLYDAFASRDGRFRDLATHVDGARMLRQNPSECLFSFICSSNNHISRIHGMVEKMCERYGEALPVTEAVVALDDDMERASPAAEASGKEAAAAAKRDVFYSFPSASRIASEATEEELRAMGFGYRAKFIVGTAKALMDRAKALGGDATPESYLRTLRDETSYVDAHVALQELPGIGPKVSSCVCLFSLDKHAAIPVDTHVWRLACEHYAPELSEAKTVTPKIMRAIEQRFEEVFGEYSGWAHNILFIAELKTVRDRLPENLRTPQKPKKPKTPKRSADASPERVKVEIKSEPFCDTFDSP
ncbi:DNA glycosylase [Ostreococcus tauri]|uniref:DNA-(apurinic or apyrimidinic site) lyase n=1 Tax=Ostreococcus tauri TaxID=70448 RepID=A0A1Y5I6M6_OSTTA|nr:DNA glycosylase [Ostreococcus tauri]